MSHGELLAGYWSNIKKFFMSTRNSEIEEMMGPYPIEEIYRQYPIDTRTNFYRNMVGVPVYIGPNFYRNMVGQSNRNDTILKISNEKSEENCCICICSMSNKELTKCSSCNNLFDIECLQKWVKFDNKCPLCRNMISTL
jgi:hypothetical protein